MQFVERIFKSVEVLYEGLGVSISVFFLTLIFSLPLSILVVMASRSKNFIVKKIIDIYILIMRGTPLMLQLIVVYFGPSYLFHISINRFLAAIIAFVLNYTAYFAEIFRGGLNSISIGQYEAGNVLGLTKTQVFFRVILMQVIKRIIPPMCNEFITLIKDTALAYTIAIVELFSIAQRYSNTTSSIIPLFVAGAYYLIINYLIVKLFKLAEKKLEYYR